ncbi:MAG: hypothetical protein H7Y11_08700, partial [Armatimonadetes bacterium]|nr:hypothetical protein [Anaerolineae bacterium]
MRRTLKIVGLMALTLLFLGAVLRGSPMTTRAAAPAIAAPQLEDAISKAVAQDGLIPLPAPGGATPQAGAPIPGTQGLLPLPSDVLDPVPANETGVLGIGQRVFTQQQKLVDPTPVEQGY